MQSNMKRTSKPVVPGPILFFGSGETLPSSGKAYEYLARKIGSPPRISILETPAGFELNSHAVVLQIAEFIKKRLQNFKPEIRLIPARHKNSPFSPDNPEIIEPMLTSNWLMMGPGSPTYAVKQLSRSLAFQYLLGLHLNGSALCLASAAVLALSSHTLPVYEIYKVGDDPHWKRGLDYFSYFGLDLVFIPHWNNTDGGEKLDTSRCFMGKERFMRLLALLPNDTTVVGIDEQTALCFDFQQPCSCQVFGNGNVTILKNEKEYIFSNRQDLPLDFFGDFHIPDPKTIFKEILWQKIQETPPHRTLNPPENVLELAALREAARKHKDWKESDRLREMIMAEGWMVQDTPEGPKLEPEIIGKNE